MRLSLEAPGGDRISLEFSQPLNFYLVTANPSHLLVAGPKEAFVVRFLGVISTVSLCLAYIHHSGKLIKSPNPVLVCKITTRMWLASLLTAAISLLALALHLLKPTFSLLKLVVSLLDLKGNTIDPMLVTSHKLPHQSNEGQLSQCA